MKEKIIEILNDYIPPSGQGTGNYYPGNSREIVTQIQSHLLEVNYKHGREEREFCSEIANILDEEALTKIMYSFCPESNRDRFSALKAAGLKLEEPMIDNLFISSAHHDNLETVQFLSSLCSNINTTNNFCNKISALGGAVERGLPSIVQFLLDEKANVNAYSDPIKTYVYSHLAPSMQGIHVERWMKFCPKHISRRPEPLIHCAFRLGRDNIVKLLLDNKVTPDPDSPDSILLLCESIYAARIGTAIALFDAKAYPNPDSPAFKDLLFLSSAQGHKDIMHAFLNAKATLDPNSPYSKELLCESIAQGHIEIMQALLEAKADPNLWDSTTKSKALHLAIEKGQYHTGVILVESCLGVNWWEPLKELTWQGRLEDGLTPLERLESDESPLSEPKSKLIELLERGDPSVVFRTFMERYKANDEFLQSLDKVKDILLGRISMAEDILSFIPKELSSLGVANKELVGLILDLPKDPSTSTMSKLSLIKHVQKNGMKLFYQKLALASLGPEPSPEEASCAQASEDSSAHDAPPAPESAAAALAVPDVIDEPSVLGSVIQEPDA